MSLTPALLRADDLFRMPRDGWRYELVEGVLHRIPSAGFDHGSIAGRFGGLLFTHVHPRKLGRVLAAETGFLVSSDPDTVLAPDVAFVGKERLVSFEPGHPYFPGAPDFLVEVLSPSDTYSEVEKKVDMAKLEEVLMREGIEKFADPQKALLALVAKKRG